MKLNIFSHIVFLFSLALLNNLKASNIPLDITRFGTDNVIPRNFSGELSPEILQKILSQRVQRVFCREKGISGYQRNFIINQNESYAYESRSLYSTEQIPINPIIEIIYKSEEDPAEKIWNYQLKDGGNLCFNFTIIFRNIKKAKHMDEETRKHFNQSMRHFTKSMYSMERPVSGTIEDQGYLEALWLHKEIDDTLIPKKRKKELKKSFSFYKKHKTTSESERPTSSRETKGVKLKKSTSFYKKDKISNKSENPLPSCEFGELIKEIKKKQKKTKK